MTWEHVENMTERERELFFETRRAYHYKQMQDRIVERNRLSTDEYKITEDLE